MGVLTGTVVARPNGLQHAILRFDPHNCDNMPLTIIVPLELKKKKKILLVGCSSKLKNNNKLC